MPEMRRNPITKSWTIIATERAKRPEKPAVINKNPEPDIAHESRCFFCLGNEYTTPSEVYALRDKETLPDTPGWSIRVIPNKFAALNSEQEFKINHESALKISSYAAGAAEVIVESNHHSRNLALLPVNHIASLLGTYKERYLSLSTQSSIKYILIFRNNGAQAGASLTHPHSQIIATSIIPVNVAEELIGASEYYESTGRCVYCDIVRSELLDRSRIICENKDFIAFVPYAARVPFETWVMPKFHSVRYEDMDEKQINDLAEIWKTTLYKIYDGLDNPPYNYFIHTSPTQKNTEKYYHWHMELIPKLTIAAGFELGTGMYINVAIPEDCAKFLRDQEVGISI